MSEQEIDALEVRWIQERTPENRERLKKALEDVGKKVWLVADTLFTPAELPPRLGQVLESHKKLTEPAVGQRQQVLVDLLLFRVYGSAALTSPKEHPEEVFAQIDRMVTDASDEIESADFAEVMEDASRRKYAKWDCYATETSHLVNASTFSFDLDMYKELLEDEGDEEAEQSLEDMRVGLAAQNDRLAAALKELASAGIKNEEPGIKSFSIDDSSDDHGFLAMPWDLSVGSRHAIAEVRRGTWY